MWRVTIVHPNGFSIWLEYTSDNLRNMRKMWDLSLSGDAPYAVVGTDEHYYVIPREIVRTSTLEVERL